MVNTIGRFRARSFALSKDLTILEEGSGSLGEVPIGTSQVNRQSLLIDTLRRSRGAPISRPTSLLDVFVQEERQSNSGRAGVAQPKPSLVHADGLLVQGSAELDSPTMSVRDRRAAKETQQALQRKASALTLEHIRAKHGLQNPLRSPQASTQRTPRHSRASTSSSGKVVIEDLANPICMTRSGSLRHRKSMLAIGSGTMTSTSSRSSRRSNLARRNHTSVGTSKGALIGAWSSGLLSATPIAPSVSPINTSPTGSLRGEPRLHADLDKELSRQLTLTHTVSHAIARKLLRRTNLTSDFFDSPSRSRTSENDYPDQHSSKTKSKPKRPSADELANYIDAVLLERKQ
ncbi:hypothetical protein PYCC9005_003615 [Savitreella phatthalungensis]